MSQDKYKPPERELGDDAHAVAKAVISSMPAVGSPAAEFFQALVVPPLEKRRQTWMEDIAAGLRDLEKNHGVRVEELKNNDQFISTLMQATQVAIRTHQEEKKTALRNAVLNAALPQSIDDATQQMFLAFVDSFTEWHLRILKLFQKPPALTGVSMGGLTMIIVQGFPELQGKESFYEQVWNDLWARGLVTTDSIRGTMTAAGLAAKRTSDFGDQFVSFVSAP